MKAKINIKFVVILLIAAFIVTGAVGGVWYYRHMDASRNFRIGDEFYAQGYFEDASRQYARGIGKEPANREYLHKLQQALLQLQPQTAVEARDFYNRYLSTLRHATQYHPHIADYHLKLLEEVASNAQSIATIGGRAGPRAHWQQLTSSADDMLQRLPASDPAYPYAYFYRGWATAELMGTATDAELDRAVEDLKRFLEAVPDHDRGWATLARTQRALANHFRTEGQQRKGDQFSEDYYDTIERAYQQVPDGKHVLAVYTRHVLDQLSQHPDDTIIRDHANELADQIYEFALQSDEPTYINLVASVLLTMRDIDRIRQGFEIFASYLDRNPNAHLQRQYLATLHYRLEEFDAAETLLQQVLDAEPLRTSFLSQIQPELRRHSAAMLVNTAHRKWQQAPPDEQADAANLVRQRHQRLRRDYVADADSDPLMIRADAVLALVERDFHTAADRLERLIRQGVGDYETLSHAAFALERIGQLGLAHERMSQAVDAIPIALPGLLYNKALFEFRLGRFEEARQTIRELQPIAPDDARILQLSQAIDQQLAAASSASGSIPGEPRARDGRVAMLDEAQGHYEAGDADAARSVILQGLESWPDDARFHAAAARIEMLAGNAELAQQYIAHAIELQPDNLTYRQLAAMFTTDDPVEAVRRYVNETYQDDEVERGVTMLLTLHALSRQHAAAAERYQQQNLAGAHEEHATLAERLQQEADRVLDEINKIAPQDSRVIEYRLNRAIAARDWPQAESVLEEAARANADQAGGLIYRGAYLIERGRAEQAVRAFQDATDRLPFSSQAWRGLGVAYSRVGNLREAQRAFEQSYRINPNNLSTIREYLGLLERTGDDARALAIAQSSRRIFRTNEDLRDHWLVLEGKVGDQTLALIERRQRFRDQPEDVRNAMRLALFLTENEPADHLILDAQGSRRYAPRRWSLLSPAEQRRAIEEEARAWRGEVDRIVRSIYEHHGRDLETVTFEASIHRQRGDVDKGERLLREYIANLPDDRTSSGPRMILAQYLIDSGRLEQAMAELQIAAEHQDPNVRQADHAIANLRFMFGDYAGAKELYERVYAVNPSRDVALRLIESMVHLGQNEEAKQRIDALTREGGAGDRELIIHALIARGQAEEFFERGERSAGQARMDEHYRLLDEAIRAMPTNPAPHILLAQSRLREYGRTERSTLLDDAERSLNRADELAPGDARVAFSRSDVFRARGDLRSAVEEINRVLERSPTLTQAHRVRLGLYVELRDRDGAIQAARASAEAFPHSAAWQEQYARLLLEGGRMAEAADVAVRAFQIEPSPHRLAWTIGLELQLNRRSPQQLLQLLSEHRAMVDENLRLQGFSALLTHRAGNASAARQAARESYHAVRQKLQRGELGYHDLQNWFNAFSDYFASFSPIDAEQFALSVHGAEPRAEEDLDFFELMWLARIWAGTGREGVSRALELTERAERRVPDDLPPQVKAGILLESSSYQIAIQNYDAAVHNLERVIELTPDNAMARNNLAFLLVDRLGQPDRAQIHAQHAYDLMPNHPSIVDTLGWTKFNLGQHAQAETLLRRSIELRDSATSRLHLARLLIQTNRRASAAEQLNRALELDPDGSTREEINRLLADM
jgi:tetratricopeptide (TPR) repeat protein